MNLIRVDHGTAVVFGLCMAVLALALLVAFMADIIIRLNAALAEDEEADHAMCLAHAVDATSSRLHGALLRQMAATYDSDTGRRQVAALRDELTRSRSASPKTIPALWLELQADLIDPREETR